MRKVIYIAMLVCSMLTLVIPMSAANTYKSAEIATSGIINRFQKAITYYSVNNTWKTTDDALLRDFSRFLNDGIQVVNIPVQWCRLEGDNRGDYNGSDYGNAVLDGVKRAVAIATQVGLKPRICFNNLWGDEADPQIPEYVVDPVTGKNIALAIVRSTEMRLAFLDMYNHTVSYLAGSPIWGWTILGEPWYYPRQLTEEWAVDEGLVWNPSWADINQKENFITLMQELTHLVKSTLGNKVQVDVDFNNAHVFQKADGSPGIENLFEDDWGWDPRIFQTLDSIRWTFHPILVAQEYPEYYDEVYNCSLQILTYNVNRVLGEGSRAYVLTGTNGGITANGTELNDDQVQANDTGRILSDLEQLPINGLTLWFWCSVNNPTGLNYCMGKTGNPRPGYYEFVNLH